MGNGTDTNSIWKKNVKVEQIRIFNHDLLLVGSLIIYVILRQCLPLVCLYHTSGTILVKLQRTSVPFSWVKKKIECIA